MSPKDLNSKTFMVLVQFFRVVSSPDRVPEKSAIISVVIKSTGARRTPESIEDQAADDCLEVCFGQRQQVICICRKVGDGCAGHVDTLLVRHGSTPSVPYIESRHAHEPHAEVFCV